MACLGYNKSPVLAAEWLPHEVRTCIPVWWRTVTYFLSPNQMLLSNYDASRRLL